MALLDQSLDDIIKQDKLQSKKKSAQKSTLKARKLSSLSKPKSPYVRPAYKEAPLFTETYKAWNAPIAAIFTSTYIPKTEPIKLVVYNDKASKAKENNINGGGGNGKAFTSINAPGTASGIRLSTTQRPRVDSFRPSSSTGGRKGDFYRPDPSGSHRYENRRRKNGKETGQLSSASASNGHQEDRRRSSGTRESGPVSGMGIDEVRKYYSNKSQSNGDNINTIRNGKGKDNHDNNNRRGSRSSVDNSGTLAAPKAESISDHEMASPEIKREEEEQVISIKGAAPVEVDTANGPVTIEIENLDRGTTAEDVKVVCSRFGEIKSCVCSNGYSQVTYARKAAGVAAVETLNGKKADNNQILRVSMLKTPVFHNVAVVPSTYVPSSIAGPMKILTRAVQGTITNAGSIYSNQLMLAQQVLKMQQHRVAQLHLEEQEMTLRRIQGVTGPVPTSMTGAIVPAVLDLTKDSSTMDLSRGAGGLL
ncbi:hypothetical protein BGZ95_011560 [Linnemannia exigua]|uniref:RRM domain-containing protein n=1 Tax=Linnemannia exigua TaxID=604196 RepID=A0AAD4H562_9FUNG|nr:hypothetical protein BGZ95_011560 [Linnemannia exigua]